MDTQLTDSDIAKIRTTVEDSLDRIRQHPFIVNAEAGALSREQAERWIMCAGRESRSFPSILEGMVRRTRSDRISAVLRANLDDEHGNGDPEQAHFRHYLNLLEHLGIGIVRFDAYLEQAGIRLALDLANAIARSDNEGIAIGYMLVNEGMTAITYGSVHTALRRFHPAMETTFFQLHVEVDDRHIAELYTATAELDKTSMADVLFGVAIGERGMAVLLDEALGIYDLANAS